MKNHQKRWFVLLAALTVVSAYARESATVSPDGAWKVVTDCRNSGSSCVVFAQKSASKSRQWLWKEAYPSEPGVEWLSSSLAQITYSCGSPCNATQFFSPVHGASQIFPEVVAVDGRRALVAFASEGREGKKPAIVVQRIFGPDKPVAVIERDFSSVASLRTAIESAGFSEAGQLTITYQSGPNYEARQESIAIAVGL